MASVHLKEALAQRKLLLDVYILLMDDRVITGICRLLLFLFFLVCFFEALEALAIFSSKEMCFPESPKITAISYWFCDFSCFYEHLVAESDPSMCSVLFFGTSCLFEI